MLLINALCTLLNLSCVSQGEKWYRMHFALSEKVIVRERMTGGKRTGVARISHLHDQEPHG